MAAEFGGFFLCLVLVWIAGIGPAFLLADTGTRRPRHAVTVAPALGWAIMTLVGFPLVRYVAAVQSWAWPTMVLLCGASLTLAVFIWRRGRLEIMAQGDGRIPADIGLVVLGNLLLAAPLTLRGLQYTIYRSNPSDAFLYMSLAETLRAVDWTTVVRGSSLTPANWPAITDLARLSPTALFAARQVGLPLALNNVVTLAWLAELAGSSVPRFYYVQNLLAYGTALPVALALGDLLGLSRKIGVLTGFAVVLGFWARLVLETDSGYEISTLPVMLLMTYGWVRLESGEPGRPLSKRILLAVAWAAIVALYAPLALVIGAAFMLYYGLALLQKKRNARSIVIYGVTTGLALAVLTITGQVDYIGRSAWSLAGRAANEARFEAPALDVILSDGLGALWGMPGEVLWGGRSPFVRWPLDLAAAGLGLLLTLLFLFGLWQASHKNAPISTRIVFALASAGLVLSAAMLALGNHRAAGKAVTYVYPLVTIGVVLSAQRLHGIRAPIGRRMLLGVLVTWLIGQAALGLFLPLRTRHDFLGQVHKAEQYDVSAITRQLDRVRPRLLLVDIPSGNEWMFAYYSMFVFSQYPSHFQSGLIVDNNPRYQRLWLATLAAIPDYAVVSKELDYIGPQQLGVKLGETQDLVLYRLTAHELAPFLAQEALYKQREAVKEPFPSLGH